MEQRKEYVKEMCKEMGVQEDFFQQVLEEEQNWYIDEVELPPATSKNTALKENLFVLIICLVNKIPVFVSIA